MPEPVSSRVELSIAAIDELMNLLASVDAVDDLDLPDLPPPATNELTATIPSGENELKWELQ